MYYAGRYVSVPNVGETPFDGNAGNDMRIYASSTTAIEMYAGASGPTVTPSGITSFHTYRHLFSGASSVASVDAGADATGNPSTSNAGGLTIGAYGNGTTAFGSAEIGELFIATDAVAAPSSPKSYLKSRWATP